MKKVVSVALAIMVAMSLVFTAFATSSLTRTSNLSGKYNAPTINVTIPTTGSIALNPYKLTFNVGTDSAVNNVNDYICFAEQTITNASNVGVEISAVVTGKPTNITLEKTTVKKTENGVEVDAKTTKSAYMYVQFTKTSGTYAATPTFTATAPALPDAILIQSTASKNTTVLTLNPQTTTASGNQPDSAYFKVLGDIVSKPATAYTNSDKVDVTIAWTITPLVLASTGSAGTVSAG